MVFLEVVPIQHRSSRTSGVLFGYLFAVLFK